MKDVDPVGNDRRKRRVLRQVNRRSRPPANGSPTITEQVMPKLKTHKGASRRFRITPTGKVLRMHVGKSHLRRKSAPRVKATFDKMIPLAKPNHKRIKKLLPYA